MSYTDSCKKMAAALAIALAPQAAVASVPDGHEITIDVLGGGSGSFLWNGAPSAAVGVPGTIFGGNVEGITSDGMDFVIFSFGPANILQQPISITLSGFVWEQNPGTPFAAELVFDTSGLFNDVIVSGDQLTVSWSAGLSPNPPITALKLVHLDQPVVPEPSTYALMGSMLGCVALARRKLNPRAQRPQ
jgi:hypothetical protein